MSRTRSIGLAIATAIAIGASATIVHAQSGDAMAKAEAACMDQGVRPYSPAYDTCVRRVSTKFDTGALDAATSDARAVRQARELCASYRIPPDTLNYRECLNTELHRAARTTPATFRALQSDGPYAVARMDGWGNRYNDAGDRIDRHGYVIERNPFVPTH